MLIKNKKIPGYLLGILVLAAVFFSACKKDTTDTSLTDTNGYQTGSKEAPILQRIVPPGGCEYHDYPLLYYPRYVASDIVSPAAISWPDVKNFYDQNDPSCDYVEYIYAGTDWIGTKGITAQGVIAMGPHNQYGDPWAVRVRIDGAYTKVFVPKSFVYAWFTSDLSSFNDNVRLVKPNSGGGGGGCSDCVPFTVH